MDVRFSSYVHRTLPTLYFSDVMSVYFDDEMWVVRCMQNGVIEKYELKLDDYCFDYAINTVDSEE